jgi:3-hydroxyacyl-CoA dehydrogenase/enoyl-CoA hydratase/3-hydroxybutyryl-CoA epimerase
MAMSSGHRDAAWRLERAPDGLWTLWFDQPGRRRNALDPAALQELGAHLVEAKGAGGLRGLVIRSAKPAGFCGGIDLGTILSCRSSGEIEEFVRSGQSVLDRLAALELPTIAVIHGACLGAGLELALACRRRVALASAAALQVGTPEVEHGLIPAWGAIDRLPRLMGPEHGLDLLISGRLIGYLLARSYRIVDRLAAAADSTTAIAFTGAPPIREPTWTDAEWETAWSRAREDIDDQPGRSSDARNRILAISETYVARGREAAREDTVAAFVALAMTEPVRAALADFLENDPDGRVP